MQAVDASAGKQALGSDSQNFAAAMGSATQNGIRGLKEISTLAGSVVPGSVGDSYAREYQRLKSEQADANALDAPLMHTKAGLGGAITGYGLQALLPGGALKAGAAGAETLGAARGAQALREASSFFSPTTYGGAARLGAAMGATQPIAEGQGEDSRLLNTAVGAGAGVVGNIIPRAISAGVQSVKPYVTQAAAKLFGAVDPETAALAQRAQQLGINLTAPQLSSARVPKLLDSVSAKVPFSGAGAAQRAQQAQFNRAVASTFGESTDKITPDVYAAAKQRIGQTFNDLTKRNSLKVSDQLLNDLGTIQQEAVGSGDEGAAKAVNNAIAKLLDKQENGTLPGRIYQTMDSEMGRAMKSGGSPSYYLGQVRDAIRNAMDQSIAPEDQAAWQTARAQYKALKTVRDLVSKDSGNGNISPASLMGRVTANNAGKEAMASGRGGDLGDLARIGQRFLKDPIPNSGTPERLLGYGALGGAGILAPFKVIPLVAGARGTQAVLQSPSVARAMLG